jgi:hypothetical protein
MVYRRYCALILLVFIFGASLAAQQASPTSTTQAQVDPQAVTILNQVMAAAGGSVIVSTVQDVTASGTITFSWAGQDVSGNATLKGRGTGQFRLDASLPDGSRTWTTSNGREFKKDANGTVTQSRYHIPANFTNLTFPLAELAVALQDPSISLIYVALETKNSVQVHHIRLTKTAFPNSDAMGLTRKAATKDFLVDAATFQIRSVVSVAFQKDNPGLTCPREIEYSDYRTINGIQVPFSITELIDGQNTFTIQLNQLSFNNSLSDSDFQE